MISYLWIKALHVTAVLTWLGGFFVLSLIVNTQWHASGLRMPQERRLLIIVRGWDRCLTIPAMLVTWGFGLLLSQLGDWSGSHWLWAKFVVVFLLSALHGIQGGTLKRMIGDANWRPSPRLRWATLVLIPAVASIVCLVIVKPSI